MKTKMKLQITALSVLMLLMGGCQSGTDAPAEDTGTHAQAGDSAADSGTAGSDEARGAGEANGDAPAEDTGTHAQAGGSSADTGRAGNATGSDETTGSDEANGGEQETGGNTGGTTETSREAGWYARVKVYATAADGTTYAHTTAGVFGELKESRSAKDRHDIPSYGPAALQVVFPHYDWGEGDSGDYWSDYRKFAGNEEEGRLVYTFLVRNQKDVDLSNASLRIAFDPVKRVEYANESNGNTAYEEKASDTDMLKGFTLVDVDTGRTYAMDEIADAQLSMEGKHTRTFRIVKGTPQESDFAPLVMPE